MKKQLHLQLATKILFYFLLVSLVPLIISTTLLVNGAKQQILQSAINRQQTIANDTAGKVDNYLANKINAVVTLSQALSANNLSNQQIDQSIALVIHYDSDISDLYLLNANGVQTNVFNRTGEVKQLTVQSDSDAYKAATYLSGKPFVSSVSYNEKNEPVITIAVPVLKSDYAQNLNNLTKANFGNYDTYSDIQGVIVAKYDIAKLWQSVLSTKIGQGGYAYVVDSLGNLVAHPDQQFLSTHQKIDKVLAVQNYINNNYQTKGGLSETGQKVISTPAKINNNNWAVIVEEPVSSVYSRVNSYIRLSIIIIVSAEIAAVLLGLLFRKQLTDPISKLSDGAKELGGGNLDYKIDIKTNDELSELADTFNVMSSDIKQLVGNLEAKNATLATEQTKLNSIISSVSDGIIALNDKGQIISINPPAAMLLKKQPEAVHGQVMSNLFAWERDNNHFVPELNIPGSYHYTDIVLPRGNDYLYLDLMVSVIANKDSEVKAIISIHDQTKSRELDFMKLDFVAIAAHELRTPLTVIQGYLNMLNENAVKQLSIYNIENLVKAETGANQLKDLINKLLSISRIERGKLEVNISKLDIHKLVKNIVDQQTSTASQKEQSLRFHTTVEQPIYVPGDASSLSEVLNNLIGNALKFTPEGGDIKVKLTVDGENVKVEVIDSGPGIPSSLRGRLFTKFYRAERSLTAGSRGTGLGLYISKTIIELHHGKIGIEPEGGKGSTFYFTLPIYNEATHAELIKNKSEAGGVHGWFKKHTDS